MKNELSKKIMKTFFWLTAKTYSYLIDDSNENKKSTKRTKKCVMTKTLNFKIIKIV